MEDVAQKVNRPISACVGKARYLRLTAPGKRPLIRRAKWTTEEEEILRQGLAAGQTLADIAQKVNHPIGSCGQKARHMQIQKKGLHKWTIKEEEILKQGISEGQPLKDIAQKLGRTIQACKYRVTRLNGPQSGCTWSEEDNNILIDGLVKKMAYKDIAQKLGRSDRACKNQKTQLRAAFGNLWWSEEDDAILIQGLDNNETYTQIALKVGRTRGECHQRACQLKRAPKVSLFSWTPDEEEIIIQEIRTRGFTRGLTTRRLAEKLPRRTRMACLNKIYVLGLK